MPAPKHETEFGNERAHIHSGGSPKPDWDLPISNSDLKFAL